MNKGNKIKTMIYLFILFFIYNCASPAYQRLSVDDPGTLLLMKDSLLAKHGQTKRLLQSIVRAHNSFGISAMEEKDYSAAIDHFTQSQELNANDTTAKSPCKNSFVAHSKAKVL